jgi:hypothetical protein
MAAVFAIFAGIVEWVILLELDIQKLEDNYISN